LRQKLTISITAIKVSVGAVYGRLAAILHRFGKEARWQVKS
jgi:hypothetical protein